MRGAFDVAIVGSGFAGSLLALVARRLSLSVFLLEKGSHPRFAIGESTSPLANLLLEELATRYALPRLLPFAKWGSWRRAYPEVSCGLKRGFSFFQHAEGRPFANDPDRQDQLLVAASPDDEVADTHWYRPDFDAFLVEEAREAGVEYLDETGIESTAFESGRFRIDACRRGKGTSLRSRFLVDASGRSGALHDTLGVRRVVPFLSSTQGLFTHFEGVRRLDEIGIPGGPGIPPYPIDDAAVHHVFPGGWIWILRFNNGLTSAGVAASDTLADAVGFARGETAWKRLLARFPTIQDQFESAPDAPLRPRPATPSASIAPPGPGWALLPSPRHRRPLLSTGLPARAPRYPSLAEALEGDSRRRASTPASPRTARSRFEAARCRACCVRRSTKHFVFRSSSSCRSSTSPRPTTRVRAAPLPTRLAGTFLCGSQSSVRHLDACCRARSPRGMRKNASAFSRTSARRGRLVDVGASSTPRGGLVRSPPPVERFLRSSSVPA